VKYSTLIGSACRWPAALEHCRGIALERSTSVSQPEPDVVVQNGDPGLSLVALDWQAMAGVGQNDKKRLVDFLDRIIGQRYLEHFLGLAGCKLKCAHGGDKIGAFFGRSWLRHVIHRRVEIVTSDAVNKQKSGKVAFADSRTIAADLKNVVVVVNETWPAIDVIRTSTSGALVTSLGRTPVIPHSIIDERYLNCRDSHADREIDPTLRSNVVLASPGRDVLGHDEGERNGGLPVRVTVHVAVAVIDSTEFMVAGLNRAPAGVS
jgi:hypothetical protein